MPGYARDGHWESRRGLPTNGYFPGITLADDGIYSVVLPNIPVWINNALIKVSDKIFLYLPCLFESGRLGI